MSIILEVNGYEYPVEITEFPGGELNVNILKGNKGLKFTSVSNITIKAKLRSSNDVMALLLTKEAVNAFFRGKEPYGMQLDIFYLPYARQDRICNRGESHSLRVMCGLINSMNFDTVTVADCHSDVGTSLLKNAFNGSQHHIINECPELSNKLRSGNYVVVSPDAGAEKKATAVAKHFGCELVRATKTRDVATGEITDFRIIDQISNMKNYIIIDDICDGGGTFIPLAKNLRMGSILQGNKIELYVTHGIFSKGLQILLEVFDTIYTTDSYFEGESTERVRVLEL